LSGCYPACFENAGFFPKRMPERETAQGIEAVSFFAYGKKDTSG
jgi:hypothetical protein